MGKALWANEADLRKAVREATAPARWIEPAAGSTLGLADTVIPRGDRQVQWVELKSGTLRHRDGGDELLFKVRPAQKENAEWAGRYGQALSFLVAEKGGNRVWAFMPEPAVLNGCVALGGIRQWEIAPTTKAEAKSQLAQMLMDIWRFHEWIGNGG